MKERVQARTVESDNTVIVYVEGYEMTYHFNNAEDRDNFLLYLNDCMHIEVREI